MTSVGNRPATDDTSRFGVSETPTDARTVLGHPRGLFVLFFAEMWERFSYYGMRAILIFYLTKHFLFAKDHSYAVYGTYTSLVYITPVIGGYLADRFLGARKAVLAGVSSSSPAIC